MPAPLKTMHDLRNTYNGYFMGKAKEVFNVTGVEKLPAVDLSGIQDVLQQELVKLKELETIRYKKLTKTEVEKIHAESLKALKQVFDRVIDDAVGQFSVDKTALENYKNAFEDLQAKNVNDVNDTTEIVEHYRKTLQQERDNYLNEVYEKEHYKQLAYISAYHNLIRRFYATQQVMQGMRKSDFEAAPETKEYFAELEAKLGEHRTYEVRTALFNPLRWLFKGPYGTIITYNGSKFTFHPKDPEARKMLCLELFAMGATSVNISLGSGTMRTTSVLNAQTPETSPELFHAAMDLTLRLSTGGMEFPYKHNSFRLNLRSIMKDSNVYSTEWNPQKLREYMNKQYEIVKNGGKADLLPKGFKFPGFKPIKEVNFTNEESYYGGAEKKSITFHPNEEQQVFIDNAKAMRKEIIKTQTEILQKIEEDESLKNRPDDRDDLIRRLGLNVEMLKAERVFWDVPTAGRGM